MKRINWRKVGAVADAVWRTLLLVGVLVCMFREDYSPAIVLMLILVSNNLMDIEKAVMAKRTLTITKVDR